MERLFAEQWWIHLWNKVEEWHQRQQMLFHCTQSLNSDHPHYAKRWQKLSWFGCDTNKVAIFFSVSVAYNHITLGPAASQVLYYFLRFCLMWYNQSLKLFISFFLLWSNVCKEIGTSLEICSPLAHMLLR